MKSNLIKNKTLVLYLSFFTLLILVTGCASTPAKDNDTAAKKAPKSQGIVIQNGEYSIQYKDYILFSGIPADIIEDAQDALEIVGHTQSGTTIILTDEGLDKCLRTFGREGVLTSIIVYNGGMISLLDESGLTELQNKLIAVKDYSLESNNMVVVLTDRGYKKFNSGRY